MLGTESDLLIVAALRPEARAVLRALPGPERLRGAGIALWRATPPKGRLWLVRTGVGPARASLSLSRALRLMPRPQAVLDLGCAGGLVDSVQPGTAIAVSCVRDCDGNSWTADPGWASILRAAAAQGGVPCPSGVLLSSPVALRTRAEKVAAAERHGAVCVSMETASVARAAMAAGIPFASLRVVLDGLNTDLQRNSEAIVSREGRPLLGGLLRHPLAALGLARAMRDVERTLHTVVASLLRSLALEAGVGTVSRRRCNEAVHRRGRRS